MLSRPCKPPCSPPFGAAPAQLHAWGCSRDGRTSKNCRRCSSSAYNSRHGCRATAAADADAARPRQAPVDVLLVDGTNVLSRARSVYGRGCRLSGCGDSLAASFGDWLRFLATLVQPQLVLAVFDPPRQGDAQQQKQERSQLAPEYLQRRRRRQQQRSAGGDAPTPAGGGDPLVPLRRRVQQLGGVSLVAASGWEADDGLAAACRAVLQRHPSARVAVASGDGDVQQLLAPQVDWLQLLAASSAERPLGVASVTAEEFERGHGFPPALYPDWLAFTGKKEASVGGVGVSSGTAAKLLARYGGLEGVLEAVEGGQLKGWGPAAQLAIAGGRPEEWPLRAALLRRNRRLFAANADLSALDDASKQALQAVVDGLQPAEGCSIVGAAGPGSDGAGAASATPADIAELAWQHPMFARRWRQAQHLEAVQSSCGGVVGSGRAQAATPEGLAVDQLGPAVAASSGGTDCRGVATLRLLPCDFKTEEARQLASGAARAAGGAGGIDTTPSLTPLLTDALLQHIRLLRRAGYSVQLVPVAEL